MSSPTQNNTGQLFAGTLFQAASDLLGAFQTLFPDPETKICWDFVPHKAWMIPINGKKVRDIFREYDVPQLANQWSFFGPSRPHGPWRSIERSVAGLDTLRSKMRRCLDLVRDIQNRMFAFSADEGRFVHVIRLVLSRPWAEYGRWPSHTRALEASVPPVGPGGRPAHVGPAHSAGETAWLTKQIGFTAFIIPPPMQALESLIKSLQGAIVRTQIELDILQALDGKAMTLDDLETASGYHRSTLLRKGNAKGKGKLKVLMEQGLVKNERGVGYYRPDRPPP